MKKTIRSTSPLSTSLPVGEGRGGAEGPGVRPAHRLLLGSAKYYYQRYALCCEHLDEEARLILAGQRGSLRRLRQLEIEQEAAFKKLKEYLQQITLSVRKEDTDEFRQYLDTAAQKIARAGSISA